MYVYIQTYMRLFMYMLIRSLSYQRDLRAHRGDVCRPERGLPGSHADLCIVVVTYYHDNHCNCMICLYIYIEREREIDR